jgi:serine protease Do
MKINILNHFQKKLFKTVIILGIITNTATAYATAVVPPGFADLVEPLIYAVVNISTVQKPSKNTGEGRPMPFPEGSPFEEFNQFFERFGQPMLPDEEDEDRKAVSLGSGFVIDSSGYIVTNHHVIAEADEINVKFSDGKQLKAKIVGFDAKTDLSLLKVETDKPLPFVQFGDSDKSRVGDWIIAIGNPFGLGGTVTAGIISASGRDINTVGIVDNYIQTDAAINRGNSGGPMFNMQGEVIGINTAIYSPSGVNIGIGFATPSSTAKLVIEQLKKTGKVIRGLLGVKIQSITEDIAESLGIGVDQGALVVEVGKDSPAEKAGIEVGDVITAFGNQQVTSLKKLPRIVAESPIGKETEVTILRNGNKKILKATLIESKDEQPEEESAEPGAELKQYGAKEVMGGTLAALNDDLKKKFGIAKDANGLIILKVNRKTQWSLRGLKIGDVVVSANQINLKSVEQLNDIINKARSSGKKTILLLINRQGQSIFIPFSVKEK